MRWIVIAASLIVTPAYAHLNPGTYQGTKADGSECSMTAGAQYFENNTPHPLNERIPVTIGQDTFIVGHPPVIRSEESLVYFNHDLFQGLIPTRTGAKAIEIAMVHSPEFEGPRSFTYMENFWNANRRESFTCNDLKLVP